MSAMRALPGRVLLVAVAYLVTGVLRDVLAEWLHDEHRIGSLLGA